MPEFPDITVYVEALEARLLSRPVVNITVNSPFLLRTAEPDIAVVEGGTISGIRRIGKRIALGVDDRYWLVIHLMIAGRLHWYAVGKKVPAKSSLMQLVSTDGTLTLTEAGSKKRASLHVLDGNNALNELDPKGLEVLDATLNEFTERLISRNHTLKRALTSPGLFSGIGNAYSDEILHRAKLSPITQTQKLDPSEIDALYHAIRSTLDEWTIRLRADTGNEFPKKVTAFREGMAVHGRYQQPCPACQTAIQRIRYVGNETNYCPRCQTGGRLLADRALSRLLKKDWPKTIEELERGR